MDKRTSETHEKIITYTIPIKELRDKFGLEGKIESMTYDLSLTNSLKVICTVEL